MKRMLPSLSELSNESLIIKGRFISKKNLVFLVELNGQRYVLKQSPESSKEAKVLQELARNHVQVPKLYPVTDQCLLMEYIEGETVCDFLFRQEQARLPVGHLDQFLANWLTWLKRFYQVFQGPAEQTILGDANLRNFILRQKQIYGIDFEECRPGEIQQDIAKIGAFLISYRPSFTTWKLDLAGRLMIQAVREFELARPNLCKEMAEELRKIGERRDQPVPAHIYQWIASLA